MALKHGGIIRIAYVRLALNDSRLRQAQFFYCDSLGLVETFRQPDRLYLRCWHEAFPYSLVLDEAPENRLVEIGFQVRDAGDLETLEAAVNAAGVAVTRAPAGALTGMGESITFAVPGGPVLRLFAELPQIGYMTGFDSPDWVTPRALRGTPAPFFLNHAGITVSDPQAAVDFLTGVLGFVVSERIDSDDGARLLSALLFRMSKEAGGQELALFPGPAGRLHHIAFTKEDPNDILIDGQYLREAGVNIDIYGPTRQSYGKTFSLHFHDPFGIRLELCSGGRITEVHPQFQPVRWTESQLGKALSYFDRDLRAEFLQPSL
ncbi:VOC family protein [Immundisolibacter sp.]|uniref:VOC family protein n=1 Tax=Immundisolibacter sp. TaxID=1934948 RepID=UPI003F85F8D0